MTVAEQSAKELEKFYVYDGERTFTILDCVSGKPVSPSGVPYFIRHDAKYKQGIATLRNMPNLTCNFWLAYHGSAASLGLKGSFEKAIRRTDIFVPEATLYTPDAEDLYNSITNAELPVNLQRIEAMIDPAIQGRQAEFHKRQLTALYGTHVLVKLADISQADMEQSPALADLYSASRKYAYNSSLNAVHNLLWTGLMCYHREWLIVAKLGVALQSLSRGLADKPDLSALFFLGAMHYGVAEKLRSLGVQCRILYYADEAPLRSDVRALGKVFAQSSYTFEDAQKYAAYLDKLYATVPA